MPILSLFMSKCHIVGNLMSRLIFKLIDKEIITAIQLQKFCLTGHLPDDIPGYDYNS